MVTPWLNYGRRRSVGLLRRFRSVNVVKKRFVLSSTKTSILNSMDRFNDPVLSSKLSTSSSTWRPRECDGLESFWDLKSSNEQSGNGETVEPLVIRNPVHSRKLEEPIERKREYWSENLLYVMRREGLIPKNRPVVMDRPTPEEPYRLSANVVRLLEQEPQLYMTKSNIKISSFDSETSEKSSSFSAESRNQQPFPHSKANHSATEEPASFEDSYSRPPHKCCDCGRGTTTNLFSAEDLSSRSFSSLSESRSRQTPYGQSRHYSTTATSKALRPASKGWVVYSWNPTKRYSSKFLLEGSDEISRTIMRMWLENRQKPSTFARKLKMKEQLETKLFTNYNFTITGSSANGFGFDNSDVDMNVKHKDGKLPGWEILMRLRAHLIGSQEFRDAKLINAICPILQFDYVENRKRPIIRVDVNADGNVGTLNTQLLLSYSCMDERVAPLVGACKQWASTMQIKDARKRLLSSYSLSLMVIFFLQDVKILPVLHHLVPEFASGRGFRRNQQLLLPKWSSKNTTNIGSLFQDMLRFYRDFDFEKSCISVRDGVVMDVKQAIEEDPDIKFSEKLNSRQTWGIINIQEPFNFTNTARSFGPREIKPLKRAFDISNQLLPQKGGIEKLLGISESKKPLSLWRLFKK